MNSFLIKLGINKALRAPALRDSPETVSSAGCDQGGHPGDSEQRRVSGVTRVVTRARCHHHHPALSSSLTLAQLTREQPHPETIYVWIENMGWPPPCQCHHVTDTL